MLRSVIAGLLVLVGGALQLLASLQRWARPREVDDAVESHEFDYLLPQRPWTPIGSAAELHGAALLLVAAAVVLAAVASGGRARSIAGLAAAALLALTGVHGLLSGVQGAPSALAPAAAALAFALPIALLVIAGLQLRAAPFAALGTAALLLGCTLAGQLLSAFTIAPLVAGYTSYDMTPWTETIMAAGTLLAGVLVLLGGVRPRAGARP